MLMIKPRYMHVSIYVFVCVYIHECMCMCIHVNVYIHIRVHGNRDQKSVLGVILQEPFTLVWGLGLVHFVMFRFLFFVLRQGVSLGPGGYHQARLTEQWASVTHYLSPQHLNSKHAPSCLTSYVDSGNWTWDRTQAFKQQTRHERSSLSHMHQDLAHMLGKS